MSSEIRVDGENGISFIAWVGGMPEREYIFSYRDTDISGASTQRFTGPDPNINPQDLHRIKFYHLRKGDFRR